jgi:hypothetical protein
MGLDEIWFWLDGVLWLNDAQEEVSKKAKEVAELEANTMRMMGG